MPNKSRSRLGQERERKREREKEQAGAAAEGGATSRFDVNRFPGRLCKYFNISDIPTTRRKDLQKTTRAGEDVVKQIYTRTITVAVSVYIYIYIKYI